MLAPAADAFSDDHAKLRTPSARGRVGSVAASPHLASWLRPALRIRLGVRRLTTVPREFFAVVP